MSTEFSFRSREVIRFVVAIASSADGRRVLWNHLLNAMLLATMMLFAITLAIFGLFEGLVPRHRTLAYGYGTLITVSSLLPFATMPFFSFKNLFDRCVRRLTRRRLFVNLSRHVFYRPNWNGDLSLHLAKAPDLLAEKHRLIRASAAGSLKHTSRELGMSLARSIRDAVRRSRRLVSRGRLKPEQRIVGATYGYLFGAARSKLRLRRHQPAWWSRAVSGVFYRYGALHAVFMYFIIHDRLPPLFDPVYFIARVGDLVGDRMA